MVTLPPPFTATRYSGYFWNVDTHELFSLKVSGELKKLSRRKPGPWSGRIQEPYYQISVRGYRKYMVESQLKKLKLKDSEIPVKTT